jgi:hypothetical protein
MPRTTRAAARAQQDNESQPSTHEVDTMESPIDYEPLNGDEAAEIIEKPAEHEPPAKKKKSKKKGKKGKKDKAEVKVDEVAGEQSPVDDGDIQDQKAEVKVDNIISEEVAEIEQADAGTSRHSRIVQHDCTTITVVS